MASMIFQVFGMPTTAIESMLGAIENTKFFLCTGFGDSKTFAGGRQHKNARAMSGQRRITSRMGGD
jgi:hypothetical protein